MDDIEFFCLSNTLYNKKKMMKLFNELEINCFFYSGISKNDERLSYCINKFNKRQMSITYSHLDIINNFYKYSHKEFCIICEDDIMIHKNIKDLLKEIVEDFYTLKLNIVLLGYLLPYKLDYTNSGYEIKKISNNYICYDYPEYHSGTHMYMISKSYAKYIVDKYYNNFFELLNKRHIIDKLYIKDHNKALIYPMLAIENDEQKDNYHKLCHKINYNDSYI